MFRLRFWFPVLLVVLIFASSANSQEKANDEKVELRLRLEKGQTFDQIVAMEQKVSQTFHQQRTDITQQMRFGMHAEVLDKTQEDTYKIKTTYRAVRYVTHYVSSEFSAVKFSYDSTKPPKVTSQSMQILAALVGQSLVVTTSTRGKVLKIESFKD